MSTAAARKKTPAKTPGMGDRWMTLPKAAEALGCTRHKVLTRVIAGELVAEMRAGQVVISRDSVAAASSD